MLTCSLSGGLAETPGAAVAAAIGAATSDFGGLHQKIHIHVMQVIDTGHGWKAIIQISLDPELKEDEKAELEEKPESKKKADARNRDKIYPKEETQGIFFAVEPVHEPSVHIYIPSIYEPGNLYEPDYYEAHPNYHFHFLEPGSSFWNATLELFPDIDLQETIHAPTFGLNIEPELLEAELKPTLKSNPRVMKPTPEFTGEF